MTLTVAMLVSQFPLASETFVLEQVAGLLDRGCAVDIYALDGTPEGQPVAHPRVREYALLERSYGPPSKPANPVLRAAKYAALVARVGLRSPRLGLRALRAATRPARIVPLRTLNLALPKLAAGRYDIVHCQFASIGVRALAMKRIGALSGRLVVALRGYDITGYVRRYGEGVYASLFAEADLLLANCEHFRRTALDLGCDPQKLRVHYSGIDCRRFPYRERSLPDAGPLRLVSVGRLVEKKGFAFGLRAAAELVTEGIDLRYDVIGAGPLHDTLGTLADELGMRERVTLHGALAQDEVIRILDGSHVLLAPSRTAASGDQEGPVNSVKEAHALGLPVVATRHGGIPEVVADGETGLLVPEADSTALAEKIRLLLREPGLGRRLAAAGRAQVESRFDSGRLNDELVELYGELLREVVAPRP